MRNRVADEERCAVQCNYCSTSAWVIQSLDCLGLTWDETASSREHFAHYIIPKCGDFNRGNLFNLHG